MQSNSSNPSTDGQGSSHLDTAPSTASKKHVSLAHALSQVSLPAASSMMIAMGRVLHYKYATAFLCESV